MRAKVADDGVRVADGDLDVGFEFDAGSREGGLAFLKDAVHRLESDAVLSSDCGDGEIDHEAVAVPLEPVEIYVSRALVMRKLLAPEF